MLMLLFKLDNSRFAIEAQRVVEVVPLAALEQVPKAPDCVAGLLDFRGSCIPVVDLCRLACQRDCRPTLTTRIVLVNYACADGATKTLGLLAEQVTETTRLDEDRFQSTELHVPDTPWLGRAARHDSSLVQRIDVDQLLPDSLRQQLFPAETV